MKDTCLFCFGDMMKVPGAKINLEHAKAYNGALVKVMYSPIEALEFAKKNQHLKVVLFGVGFETTIPLFASVILRAKRENIKNFYLFSAFKVIPPALIALLDSGDVRVDGFMLPGHVSTILGHEIYAPVAQKYNVSAVITGFEPVDMLKGIYMLVDMIVNKHPGVLNEYSRYVTAKGNLKAKELIQTVFDCTDSSWRGFGEIKSSGLRLKDDFREFDIEREVDFGEITASDAKGCRCADVIKGKCTPLDCGLFKRICNPQNPLGPCMVSSEGTCAAYYKYGR